MQTESALGHRLLYNEGGLLFFRKPRPVYETAHLILFSDILN